MSVEPPIPRHLHPASLIADSLRVLPQMLAGGAGYAALVAREGLARVLLFAAAAALIGVAGALIGWWRFRYMVSDGEIVIESGVLRRQRRVIPFDRVQDIAIERPLLARLFGTAKVKIETGGSAADEGKLDMIALAYAHALRDRIRHGASTVPTAAAPEEPVLFEMGIGRLLRSGLFNFSLLFLAGIFAVLQYLDQFGLIEMDDWLTPAQADAAVGSAGLRLTVILVLLLLLLGVVTGVARTVARDFGYRLTRSEAGLRRRRGLFTLSEIVIPVRRMQVALIESGPIGRWFGWHRLSFQTLGADRSEGGVEVAAPFARMAEIRSILAETGFPMPPAPEDFAGLPKRALLRQVVPFLILAAIPAVAALAFDPRAAIGAAVLLVMAAWAALGWRSHGHAIDSAALFVTGGAFKRRLWTIPFGRTQTISLSGGPLQRRLGLASLLVDTAGASSLHSAEMVDLDTPEAEALADRLLERYYEVRARTTG